MSISDHPGILNIHPDDLCLDCDGSGWLSAEKSPHRRGHPCMKCNGTGDIRYKGQPNGVPLPVRKDTVKNKKKKQRYNELCAKHALQHRLEEVAEKKKKIRRPERVGGFKAPAKPVKLEPINEVIRPKTKVKFKEFKIKGKKK